MTPKQKKCYDFIANYIAANGYSPSFDEIRAAMGLGSKSGVARLVDELIEQERLYKLRDRARTLSLTPYTKTRKNYTPVRQKTQDKLYAVKIRQAGETLGQIAGQIKRGETPNYWELVRVAEYFKNIDLVDRGFKMQNRV